MRAWPTIMSFPNSYRFRDGNQGEVLDVATDTWTAPTVNERERAMGFETDTTAAPGVSQAQRMAMIGRAFDVRAVSRLLAVTNLVNTFQTGSNQHPSTDSVTHASYALTHAESMDPHDHSTYDVDGAHDTCWKATDHLRDSLQTLLSRSTSRAQEIARHYGRNHDDPLVQLAVTQPPVEPPRGATPGTAVAWDTKARRKPPHVAPLPPLSHTTVAARNPQAGGVCKTSSTSSPGNLLLRKATQLTHTRTPMHAHWWPRSAPKTLVSPPPTPTC